MPLETCLQAVSEQSEKLHVKSLGMALRSRIQEGYTLSDSLREHPRVFDSLFCSMVAAGEKSGHLDVVLNRLADYTEQRQRLKSRLLQAMLYPLVLLVVATGVVTILLTAVVPKIIEQFDHLGHALPASTRTLIAMSDALQASGVYWLAGLLGLLVLGYPTITIRGQLSDNMVYTEKHIRIISVTTAAAIHPVIGSSENDVQLRTRHPETTAD
ncbi:general secretion pathway protein GspF [Escherichia coli]|nr:general secretion pathway protein GspF [Escherichia coli]